MGLKKQLHIIKNSITRVPQEISIEISAGDLYYPFFVSTA
jgi:hypothetical protein